MSNTNTLIDANYLKLQQQAATHLHAMLQGCILRGYDYTVYLEKMSYELRLIEAEDALMGAIKHRRKMRRTARGTT